MLTRNEKEKVLLEMVDYWKNGKSFVFYNFTKMQASDVTLLRKKLRASHSVAFVVKNTLIQLSAKQAGINLDEKLSNEMFKGQTGIVVSLEDPISGPKVIDQFFFDYRKPEIKGGFFEGRLLDQFQVKELATIPPREVLNQRLAYDLLSPVTMLARSLNSTVAKIVFAINAVKEMKEKTN
jgi:large subunit ribosomal protein L10